MTITVLFFGVLAEVTGTGLQVYEDVKSTDHLKIRVADDYPGIIHYSYRISLNNELIDGDSELRDRDEVAFLPPFAGG
jgi:sulfur-carrier protein